jgi:two-component system alkaline phosphatase synthesis response regulator PhoP
MNKDFNIVICSNSEPSIKKIVEFLEEKKYAVAFVKNEEELLKQLHANRISLVILELDLKHKDGITITSDIRNLKDIEQPFIIIFSSKQDDYIQITAFNAGADDFITTPVKPILLEARICTLKKRHVHAQNKQDIKEESVKFFVDREQYLIVTENGKISLPRKEFEMIDLMFQNAHKVFTRQDFARLIWNAPEVANSRTIDIHIRNIRRILGNDIIKTSKGVGYTINRDFL